MYISHDILSRPVVLEIYDVCILNRRISICFKLLILCEFRIVCVSGRSHPLLTEICLPLLGEVTPIEKIRNSFPSSVKRLSLSFRSGLFAFHSHWYMSGTIHVWSAVVINLSRHFRGVLPPLQCTELIVHFFPPYTIIV